MATHKLSTVIDFLKSSLLACRKFIPESLTKHAPEQVSIARKLAFILTLLIAGSMVLLGLVVTNNQTRLLNEQMNDFGKTVVNQLSESSKELILSDDSLSLMVIISNLTANHNTLGTVIYNEGGKVIAAAVLASLQPALKAARMDPIEALRHV